MCNNTDSVEQSDPTLGPKRLQLLIDSLASGTMSVP